VGVDGPPQIDRLAARPAELELDGHSRISTSPASSVV
jgi:hypothetical protein